MLEWLFGSSEPPKTAQNSTEGCPVAVTDSKCPVNHENHPYANGSAAKSGRPVTALSADRVVSSIPRLDDKTNETSKWVYPSPKQFYEALDRKDRNPQAPDMDIVVPIHNAVNEKCWQEILKWEDSAKDDIKLVSFKGRPNDLSPRARFKTFIGYSRPFDRHDWLIDRAGKRVRYVIDFYAGRVPLSFHLDVRPALDDVDGARMRCLRFIKSWVPSRNIQESPTPT